MKRLLTAFLCLILIFSLTGCVKMLVGLGGGKNEDANFDLEKDGILCVITQDTTDETYSYEAIGTNYMVKSVEPFESESTEILTINSYEHMEFFYSEEKIKEELSTLDFDENGERREDADVLKAIYEKTKHSEHDFFTCKILKCGDYYFAVLFLNVNWWSPYAFYYYEADSDRLIELNTYNGRDVVGIKLINMDNVHRIGLRLISRSL